MNYTLQEGTFSLFPAAWQDTTLNILRDDASGLSLVVSRSPIPDGSNAEKEFHRQWDTLRPQMGDITQSDFIPVNVGPARALPAVEVESAFERRGQHLWQKQLAVQAPGKPVLLLFTLSALRPFNDDDAVHWENLKSSLALNNHQDD
ncbi:DcrB-related protein [Brenneria goodwinii]|uniref:DcrB-related protein n=1 Tax=Brenneria goodwinii TaxID=1109412 RepID=UPI0036ED24BE